VFEHHVILTDRKSSVASCCRCCWSCHRLTTSTGQTASAWQHVHTRATDKTRAGRYRFVIWI